jgi:chaperonin cofactor prefoldin
MTDDSDRTDSIENRIGTIEARIDVIEIEQEQLRADLDRVVQAMRSQSDDTPHIDSVRALHARLEHLEQNIATYRQSLAEVVDDRD